MNHEDSDNHSIHTDKEDDTGKDNEGGMGKDKEPSEEWQNWKDWENRSKAPGPYELDDEDWPEDEDWPDFVAHLRKAEAKKMAKRAFLMAKAKGESLGVRGIYVPPPPKASVPLPPPLEMMKQPSWPLPAKPMPIEPSRKLIPKPPSTPPPFYVQSMASAYSKALCFAQMHPPAHAKIEEKDVNMSSGSGLIRPPSALIEENFGNVASPGIEEKDEVGNGQNLDQVNLGPNAETVPKKKKEKVKDEKKEKHEKKVKDEKKENREKQVKDENEENREKKNDDKKKKKRKLEKSEKKKQRESDSQDEEKHLQKEKKTKKKEKKTRQSESQDEQINVQNENEEMKRAKNLATQSAGTNDEKKDFVICPTCGQRRTTGL